MAKLRPQLLGKARQKIFLFLLILIFSGPSFHSVTKEEGFSSFSPLPSSASINSEEENIDDFSVHPSSGRWNTTDDLLTDDRIVDDNLRLITVDNTTSDTPGFQMNRDVRKTDGKVEWRSKADGSGNQTDYFRDFLGDSADFEESDFEGFTARSSTVTVNDGLLQVIISGDFQGLNFNPTGFSVSTDVYTGITFRAKSNGDDDLLAEIIIVSTIGEVPTKTFTLTNEWQSFSFIWSDFGTFTKPLDRFVFESTSSESEYPNGFFLEEFAIVGDLDFATHIDGEIEDTWDFEDSLDYFFDDFDNISDFNDGTDEVWTAGSSTAIDSVGGWLEVTNDQIGADTTLTIESTGLTISTVTYEWFTFEMEVISGEVTAISITDGVNQVGTDTTNHVAGEFVLYSLDLGLDADWTGVETDLQIVVLFTTSDITHQINYNFTFLYDVELGDPEDFDDTMANYDYVFVNPLGYLETSNPNIVSNAWFRTSSTNIDTSIFTTIKIRVKGTTDGQTIQIANAQINKAFSEDITITTSFQTLEIDLTADPDWTGIQTVLGIIGRDDSGNFEGNERILIDWILLLGAWDEVDSTIGLYDDNSIGPLLNVSTHIFSDTSIGARFEVELLDLSGEIAYQFISNNFTDLTDLWVRGKITYDALRSSLSVEVKSDNLTRIFKVTFPVDFTEISGRIPALFQLERMPAVFVSTFTPAISWQELTLGNILAPFKEREWQHVTVPSDSDFLSDSWIAALVENNITSDQSKWRLNVPYLDSVSGLMIAFQEDDASEFQDNLHYRFTLYGVDGDDGDLHKIAGIEIEFLDNNDPGGDALNSFVYIEDGNSNEIYEHSDNAAVDGVNVQFSIGLSSDRSEGNIRIKSDIDLTIDDDSEIGSDNFTVSDWVTDPSQEFVLEVDYDIEAWGGATQIRYALEGFELKERDIFADFINAIIEPVGNFITDLLIAAFRFIAGIFKFIGDLISLAVSALEPFLTVIAVAIGNLASDIWAGIGSALDFITTAIAEIAADVATAFLAIVDDIISALITLASSIMDIVAAVIPLLLTFLGTILIDLVDFIADVIFFWWEAMALPDILAIAELALDFLTELVDWLIITIAEIIQFAVDVSWIILVVWWFICIPVQFGRAGSDPFGGIANAIEFFFGNTLPISILGTSIYLPQGLVATAWLIILLPADFAIFTALA